jgi:hypothetical protein
VGGQAHSPVFKAKTKLISVRVSEEDFSIFRQICDSHGFVTFSDLVRTAIQELISNRSGPNPSPIHSAMLELSTRMDKLCRDFDELKRATPET